MGSAKERTYAMIVCVGMRNGVIDDEGVRKD
jgi:hypothetical protein